MQHDVVISVCAEDRQHRKDNHEQHKANQTYHRQQTEGQEDEHQYLKATDAIAATCSCSSALRGVIDYLLIYILRCNLVSLHAQTVLGCLCLRHYET